VITKAEPTQIDVEIMALLEHRQLIENKFDLRRMMGKQYEKDYSFEVLRPALDRLIEEGSVVETDIGYEPAGEVPVVISPVVAPQLLDRDLQEMGSDAYRAVAAVDPGKLISMADEMGSAFDAWLDIASGDPIVSDEQRAQYFEVLEEVLKEVPVSKRTVEMERYGRSPQPIGGAGLGLTRAEIEQVVLEKRGECAPCTTKVPIGVLRDTCAIEEKACEAVERFANNEITAEQMLSEVERELTDGELKTTVKGIEEYFEEQLQ
jgi:hypothetical protein